MAKYKKTSEEVKSEVSQLKEKIKALKEQAREQGLAFASLDDDKLARKVRGETADTPFGYGQGWTSATSPGNPASFSVHVRNPDPSSYSPVYVTIFFGLGNFFDVNQAWVGRDKRWPEFSSERTFLLANSDHTFSFSYTVPMGLPQGTYNGNWVLWRGDWLDTGVSFDRGSFDMKLL